MFRTTIPHVILITCLIIQVVVEGSAVFKIQLTKYDNRFEKDWGGKCCDQSCTGKCDHKFTVCLDRYQGNDNFRSCQYFRQVSRSINNRNVNFFKSSIGGIPNPINKYLTTWPLGGIKLKVQVYDKDDFNGDDLVDRLFKVIVVTPARGEATASWIPMDITGIRNKYPTILSFKYTVYCEKDFFGPTCSVKCKAKNDQNGHYRCDPDTGAKVCLSGWEDPHQSCTILMDNCAGVDCQNGATCIDKYDDYTCVCPEGFSGDHCEINEDECASEPCQNGAECLDGEDSYTCKCTLGYVGINCESHVCTAPTAVCLNNGTCYGSGQCYCLPGFVGSTCDIHRCNVIVCLNGGTCNDDGTCTCPPGYLGALCGVTLDAWMEHACQTIVHCNNGGTCHAGKCYCPEDYTGRYCSTRVDDCVGDPCLNDGVCVDGISSYTCRCQSDFNGTLCEERLVPPKWNEQTFEDDQDDSFDEVETKRPFAAWLIGVIVLLIILVCVVVALLFIYRRKFKRAKKASPSGADLGNFDNPTYGNGRPNPAFFSVDTSTVSLASSPSAMTDSIYAASEQDGGAQSQEAENHVYDNPELLKKQIHSISSDYSDLPSPPLPPERNLSTASDPFSEYAVPVGPARPVLPDLIEGQDASPTITKTWPPEEDDMAAAEMPPKTPL